MCQFNFCFSSMSFSGNSTLLEEIYTNIENLAILKEKINDASFSETLFRKNDIYNVDVYSGYQLHEVLYGKVCDFKTEYKQMLALIVDRAKEYDDVIVDKYVGLNSIKNENLIYNVEDWFNFHYNSMKKISNDEQFLECIDIYFQKLKFHDNVVNTLGTLDGGLALFSSSIVQSLIYLENNLNKFIVESDSLPNALQKFSSELGLETTLEGDISRKAKLTFTFKKNDGTAIDIYCEPHIKLSKSSISGDSKHYHNRIYFYQGREDIEDKKVLIGHIGGHL